MSVNNRTPCSQSNNAPQIFFGGCNGYANSATQSVTILQNVTKIKDYASGSNLYIDPFPLINVNSIPFCDKNHGYICGDGINGNEWCYPVTNSYWQTASIGTSSFNVSPGFNNNYIVTTGSIAACSLSNVGWKRVWAKKTFHGIVGFISPLNDLTNVMDSCDTCAYHTYDASPDNTRYLTLAGNVTFNNTHIPLSFSSSIDGTIDCGSGPFDNTCETPIQGPATASSYFASQTVTIDAYGNVAANTCASSSDGAFAMLAVCNDTAQYIVNQWIFYYGYYTSAYGASIDTDTSGGNRTAWSSIWQRTDTCLDECGNVTTPTTTVAAMQIDLSAHTLHRQEYERRPPNTTWCLSNGTCYPYVQTIDENYSYTNTNFNYTLRTEITGGLGGKNEVTISAVLSNVYTSTDVANATTFLLGKWDLGNNFQYPWRTDGYLTQGPLVSFDESPDSAKPILLNGCDTTNVYSGQVLGAPGPVGIDRVLNTDHENYCVCYDTDNACYIFYTNTNGAWSTDCNVPAATQWLNTFQSNTLPDASGFVGNGFQLGIASTCVEPAPWQTDIMWACKGAETILPNNQSYNFFGPCGQQRFALSASTERCIVSNDSGSITLNGSGPASVFNAGDELWICGTSSPNIDGLWQANTVSDYVITLHNQQLVASTMTIPPQNNCGNGSVTALYWQSPMKPAICGELSIVSANNNNPITCSVNQECFLVTGDTVYISNATGLTTLNGTQSVTRIDNTHIAINSVSGIAQPVYTGNGIMVSPNTPDQSWDTNETYGTFTYNEWLMDFRGPAEYQRMLNLQSITGSTSCDGVTPCPAPPLPTNPRAQQAICGLYQQVSNSPICSQTCLPFSPCSPSVAYYSPNSESFNVSSSVNLGWTWPGFDVQYGTQWLGTINQVMKDPLFMTPPAVCGGTVPYIVDNYTCLEDDVFNSYYPAPNQYESLCSAPSGSPALPTGFYLGCLSPSDLVSGCVAGNICNPPQPANSFPSAEGCGNACYEFNDYQTNIQDYLNKLNCVNNNGRFAAIYAQNL